MQRVTVLSIIFLLTFASTAFAQLPETDGGGPFGITVGVGFDRHHAIEIVGYPFVNGSVNARPEFGITHKRTGTFLNFGATKTSSSRDTVGDETSLSIGWAGETEHWRFQTDLNRYDVDLTLTLVKKGSLVTIEGKERMHSLRFLAESKRDCGAPYVWLQEYGGTTAHIVGVGCNTKWAAFSIEIGGNDGISRLPRASRAFSRVKVETPPFKWLGGAQIMLVRQNAYELPFEDDTWPVIRWQWDLL